MTTAMVPAEGICKPLKKRLLLPSAIAVAVALACANGLRSQSPGVEQEFFEQQVRPILVQRCLSCHGPQKAKSGLRLDSRDAVLRGGEQGPAAVPGNPDQSRLIQAVRQQFELQMPPSGRLPDKEVRILERWVALKLPWSKDQFLAQPNSIERAARSHWAFQPIRRPAPPSPNDAGSCSTPVDTYIADSLQKAGLGFSPSADRRTLIRRATFDLLGLPPTPQEIKAFEADRAPDAYERLLDRLLASPRYGERWSRHWLDVARYADDKGYVFFEDKSYPWAFTYRDYVIESLNHDLPYDRFLLEQLAADQLKLADSRALAALGFLTVGGHFMNNTHDIIDDRIDVVSRGLMGLTVTCARCHDHKFDPIPQADYYSLYGVFRSCQEPMVGPILGQPARTKTSISQEAEIEANEQKLVHFVTLKHRELVRDARLRAADYLLAAYAARNKPPDDDFMLLADKGDLNPTMITRWRVYLEERRAKPDGIWRVWHDLAGRPESTIEKEWPKLVASFRAEPHINKLLKQALPDKIASMKDLAQVYGKLFGHIERQWQDSLEQAFWSKQGLALKLADPDAEELRGVLYGESAPADAPLALDWGFLSLFPDRATQDEYKKLLDKLDASCKKGPPRAMVLLDAPRNYTPRIFERGQPNRLGETVPRQFPRVADPDRQPFRQGSGRLEMAREIVASTNPLTARVIVNRIWTHHFGEPIVRTPSDFGLRSEAPTHPQLLDWLAADFMDHGWSIKRLHKMLMTSTVYMQSSLDRPDGQAVDPENRLYWRMNRRRLEYEPLHDALLAVADRLDQTMGGPPAAPMGASRRRAVYEVVDRLEFPSLLNTFDVPNPAASSPGRVFTTVAPQALYQMNGPFVREAAAGLLESQQGSSAANPEARIEGLFWSILGRAPAPDERGWALAFVAKEPGGRWRDLVQALLMTNEFLFVD